MNQKGSFNDDDIDGDEPKGGPNLPSNNGDGIQFDPIDGDLDSVE